MARRQDQAEPASKEEAERRKIFVEEIVYTLLRQNPKAKAAYNAMLRRGLTPHDAENEIGGVFACCLWEVHKGYPDRYFNHILDQLAAGRTANELFSD